jgi:hypothetical protein
LLEETYDLWDYFDEKRDALERLEKYLQELLTSENSPTTSSGRKTTESSPPRVQRRRSFGSSPSV